MKYTEIYPYTVEPFYMDANRTLSIPMLGKQLLNSSENHFMTCHLIDTTSKRVWVIARLIIELKDLPKQSSQYRITTWLSKNYGSFVDRCFVLTNEIGQEIGRATSVWSMINYTERTSIHLSDLFPHINECICKKEPATSKASREQFEQAVQIDHRNVLYSHLDKNGHLNSITYLEYILNTFDPEFHQMNKLARIEIAYQHECHYGDCLSIEKYQLKNNEWGFVLRKNEKSVCRAKLFFE